MTTFEMRFVAQRIKDTIAPTGTIALGVGVQRSTRWGKTTRRDMGSRRREAFDVARALRSGRRRGGAPKKFVTGALAEGEIATESVLNDLEELPPVGEEEALRIAEPFVEKYKEKLEPADDVLYSVGELEEAMQKTMDVYA